MPVVASLAGTINAPRGRSHIGTSELIAADERASVREAEVRPVPDDEDFQVH